MGGLSVNLTGFGAFPVFRAPQPQLGVNQMTPGPWQIALVVLLVLILFGRGKISQLMGDVAKGIKNFRKGLAEEDVAAADQPQKPIEDNAEAATEKTEDKVNG
jgi:sec-independent protein translocase protein TatA